MRKTNWSYLICAVVICAVIAWFGAGSPGTVDPEKYHPAVYSTIWALLPPVIAIGLALITKEVYSSLFTGIIVGALLYANGNLELMINTFLFQSEGGMITKLNAAKIAMSASIPMVIMNGSDPLLLYDVVEGKSVGTIFSQEA